MRTSDPCEPCAAGDTAPAGEVVEKVENPEADTGWWQPRAYEVLDAAESPLRVARVLRQLYHPVLWAAYLGDNWKQECGVAGTPPGSDDESRQGRR